MSTNSQFKRTRLAPTPSGFLHLGNILSFAVTAALAKKNGAKVLLRIDDLDRLRVNKMYIQDIFDTLNFMGIPWDEGPGNAKEFEEGYSQVYRTDMYNAALRQLVEKEKVFACICSRSQVLNTRFCACINRQIPLNTKNVNWRLITGDSRPAEIQNYNGETTRAGLPSEMKNFVVKKKDGFPAYQLTSVIDDLFYGIDLVVRGDDLWGSTIAQHVLALAIEKKAFTGIAFYHHPLLEDTPGKKLSKSAGAASVKYLRENGKKPGDIYQLIGSALNVKEPVTSWEQFLAIENFG